MGYNYETEKPALMTDDGQRMVTKVMQTALKKLEGGRTVRMEELREGLVGSNWTMMACVDRLCEMGILLEISGRDVPGQHRVFIDA